MMKRFIRQKNRDSRSMGVMLLIAILFLSVVYAVLYSVIYMYGTGSVDVQCNELYYYVNADATTGTEVKGDFYTSCSKGVVDEKTSIGTTKMSVAVNALKDGGTIHMLSTYEANENETVFVNSKTVKIQRFVVRDNNNNVETYSNTKNSLFDVSAKLEFNLVKDGENSPCLVIDGEEVTSSASAFNVLNSSASLTLNNTVDNAVQGVFSIKGNYSSVSGGAIHASSGSVVANAVQFTDNRSINDASLYGGAVYAENNSNVELNGCSFENNTVRSSHVITYSDSVYIKGNEPVYGGAVCCIASKVNMSGCTFTANAADVENNTDIVASGGAVYIDSRSEGSMIDCEVTNNQTSYSKRTGAGVCVEAGGNKFKLGGKTIIKENYCYFFDKDTDTGLNVNDNLHLKGNESNISIDTLGISGESRIYVNVVPTPSENSDFRSLISDSSHKASSTDYFSSDIAGYEAQSNEGDGLYLVSSSSYTDLWYGQKYVSQYDELGREDSWGSYYGFFADKDLNTDTGFTRMSEAVDALKSTGKIHMLTPYKVSVSETVNMPKNKDVNVVRENDLGSDPMVELIEGTFIINSLEESSTIIFDGKNISENTYSGGAFYATRNAKDGENNFELNGIEKSNGNKSIIIQNNDITGYSFGGGLYISSNKSKISNCEIKNNSTERVGGGIYYSSGSHVLENCNITDNKASQNGGGVYCNSSPDLTLLGTMKVTGNTANSSDNNFYLEYYQDYESALALSSGSKSLSTGSQIGLTTSKTPTEGASVKFAKSTTEDMKNCFTPDVNGYTVKYNSGESALYLSVSIYDNLWYKIDQSDANKTKKFFEGSDAKNLVATDITQFSKAVEYMSATGVIHMMTSYDSSDENETTEIKSGKNITVVRDDSFTDASMFKIVSGNFIVKATDTSSSITFDGKNIETTVTSSYGGIIHVAGSDADGNVPSLTLSGAENSGSKTINFINSFVSGPSAGGAIRNNGTATLTHCNISDNKASQTNGAIAAGVSNFGTITMENCVVNNNKSTGTISGGIYTSSDSKTSKFISCKITNNTSGQYGGGMYLNSGGDGNSPENIVEKCTVTGNTTGSSSVNGYGGGIYISPGKTGTTTISGTEISGNTAKGGALYVAGGTNKIISCTISGNVNAAWGGGVRVDGGTNIFEGCSVIGNKASSRGGGFYFTKEGETTLTRCTISSNTAPAQGGAGIFFTKNGEDASGTAGKLALSGATSIVGNKTQDSTDENNLWIGKDLTVDVSGLTDGCTVGVSTVKPPALGAPVTFGTDADETIKGYFTPDDDNYKVSLNGTDLQLGMKDYNDLWYQIDDTDNKRKKFFKGDDIDHLIATPIIKFSEAVARTSTGGTIHMLTSYDSAESETAEVPAGNKITVVRDKTFTTDSMFKITEGNFTVNAPDANSSITFDGQNLEITEIINGGAFNITGDTTQFALNGASGSKNIIVTNNIISKYSADTSSYDGESNMAAVYKYLGNNGGGIANMGSGKVALSNCLISKNSSVMSGAGVVSFGDLTMNNCDVTENYLKDTQEGMLGYGGGVACLKGTGILTDCTIKSNTAFYGGGGVGLRCENCTLTSCTVSNNYCSFPDDLGGYGSGIDCGDGVDTIENCTITDNTSSSCGGGIYVSDFSVDTGSTNKDKVVTFSNCVISNNKAADGGGGVRSQFHALVFKDCTITGNTADDGGGIEIDGGTASLLGTTKIMDNTKTSDNSANNIYVENTVINNVSIFALSDDSGNKLSAESRIGIHTKNTPPVKFAEKGDETMDNCFESDNASYVVVRVDSDFYLQPMYDSLYYSTSSGSGKFYSDSSCKNDTFMTRLSQTMKCVNSGVKIYMMSQYVSSADETVDVPAGKEVTVYRYTSFKNASMFSITGGTLTINATDPSSSITFDGNSYSATANFNGGAFNVGGSSGKLELNGASDDTQNIFIQNNCANNGVVWSGITNHGGGICVESQGGGVTCKNCLFKGNKASMRGGAVNTITGTNSFKNCTMSNNSDVYYGGAFASIDKDGLALAINTFENCSFTNNSSKDYGGGLTLDAGTFNFTNCTISGNSTGQKGGGVYSTSATATFEKCSIINNKSSGYGGGISFLRTSTANLKVSDTQITGNTVSSSSSGAGIYIETYNNQTAGKITVTGATKIKGNKYSGSESNIYFKYGETMDVTGLATSSYAIGIMTSDAPTLSSNVKFATGATDEMKDYFTTNEENREVIYENGNLYLKLAYDNLYYKGGTFYYDSSCSNSAGMTKLSDAVNHVKDGKYTSLSSMSQGKIYFKSQYSHSDETITVPSSHRIAIVRDVSVYSDTSMIDIHNGCTFKIFVPDSSSNLIIDGGSKTASGSEGGLFNVNENSSNHVTLQGTDANNKNLTVQNFWSSGVGGAICFDKGTSTIKYCNFKGNKVTSTGTGCKGGAIFIGTDSSNTHNISDCYFSENESLYSNGGAIRAENGTNTITNCTFESNKAKYGGAVAFCGGTNNVTNCTMKYNATANKGSGGAVDDYNGTNTYTDCTIENNTCDSVEGGGFCVNNQGNKITLAGKTVIANNTANGSKCNAYVIDNKIFNIASNFSAESHVGITTKVSPSSSTAVEFATGVTDSMDAVKYCFEHDPGTYKVFRALTNLMIGDTMDTTYNDLYYYRTNLNDGEFYSDANHSSWTGITTLKDAVGRINKGGKIHFLVSYNTSANGETVVVPADLGEITILRDGNFKTESMINVNGSFEVQAPHPSSTLIFDGNSVKTSGVGGGVLWLYENCSIKIKGASSSDKNIKFVNNIINDSGAGAIRVGAGSNNVLSNCVIENNKNTSSSSQQSGGILVTASDKGKDTAIEITNCDIKNNSSTYGGGLYVVSGNTKLYNCTISGNTTSSRGGGVYVSGGTNTLSSCSVTSNKASNRGGGVYVNGGTNTLSNCSITGNTSSSSSGGGVCAYKNITLLGNMNISGNTSESLGNNLYLNSSCTVALSDSSGNKLSSGSRIGVATYNQPTSGSDVKFATHATEAWMKSCFSSDSASYNVTRKTDDCLYLTSELKTYTDLYYKDGIFYGDEALTDAVVKKFSETMSKLTSNGTIHLLNRYNSSTDEETTVPAGKNITVIRERGFTDASMFYTSGGNFTINATDSTSSITFDGNKDNVIPTSSYDGGVFHINSSGCKFNLNGNSKSDGGKTITIKNSKCIGSNYWGAAIYNHGQLSITNCAMLNNEVEGSGGAMYIDSGTSVIKDCTLTGNKATTGGGIYVKATTTLLGTVNITDNSASTGDGIYLNANYPLALSSGSESLNTNSKIYVRVSANITAATDVKFATGATADMANCFTSSLDSTIYKSVYESGNLYLRRVYDTIYQKKNVFYTDEACSTKIDNVTTIARAVKIANTVVFSGPYEATSDETIIVPAGKTVTLLRSESFTNYSMINISSATMKISTADSNSKLICDGNKVDTTGAKGSMVYLNDSASSILYLTGYSSSNKNIEVKNFHTSLSDGVGGAICNNYHGGIFITNCKFTGNYSNNSSGGAICDGGGTSYIRYCDFSDNHADKGYGGAIYRHSGDLEISNCTVTDCSAKYGGAFAFFESGTTKIYDCTITNNTSTDAGPAIFDDDGTNYYKNCTITNNKGTFSSSTVKRGAFIVNSTNKIHFDGYMIIKDNTVNGEDNNLYVITNKMMIIDSGFQPEKSRIGVTTGKEPTSGTPTQFATGATSVMPGYFTSDNDSYFVSYLSGALRLELANEKQITLGSSTPSIKITPEGYYTPASSTTLNSFTGTYVLTGSYTGTSTSNPDVVFYNSSTERKTIRVKIKNLSLKAYRWCSLGLLGGNGPMNIFVTAEGTNSLQGYNHPAFNTNSDKVQGSNMYLNVKSGSTLLGSWYDSTSYRVAADGINFYFNDTLLTSSQKSKNTTFTSTGFS